MNGKFSIELEGQTFNGKFGIGCWRLVCEHHNIPITRISERLDTGNLDIGFVLDVIYFACKSYAEIKDEPFTVKKSVFSEMLSDDETNQFQKAFASLTSSFLLGKRLGGEVSNTQTKKKK